MTAQQRLTAVLGNAYAARNMQRGTEADALAQFAQHAVAYPDFLAAAFAEQSRAQSARQQCHISAVNADFLAKALASIDLEGSPDMASKLKALAGLAKDAHANVEAEAERAANRLMKATESAKAGIGKLDHISNDIETSAADLEGFANTVSNFPPPDDAAQKKKT